MAQQNRIGKVSTHYETYSDGDLMYCQYHKTKVISAFKGEIELRTGGYNTVTTRLRINQAARQFRLNVRVYQLKGVLYVETKHDRFQWHQITKSVKIDRAGAIAYKD